jgi:hypothetical protein
MAELRWRHSTTAEEAKQVLMRALAQAGYKDYVHWDGLQATVSAGPWGTLLSLKGKVTDEEIVMSCSGMLAGSVWTASRAMLEDAFPGGETTPKSAPESP